MAPRATWKGFLNLSLVSIPVKAYSANDSGGSIHLNQLHADCNCRINLKTVCPLCGDISRSDTVKGYEFAKGQYVLIDLDELDKLRSRDESRAIRIEKFMDPHLLDPIYFSESSYYLLPDGVPGLKPYALLREAMDRKSLACVAWVVLHNKEQLVLVRPMSGLLCMTVLRYSSQIKSPDLFAGEAPGREVSKAEFALAESLINETTADSFDIGDYADVYTQRLNHLIESKVEGKELVQPPDAETAPVIDLMEALKASVARVRGESGATKTPTKKKVARKKIPSEQSKQAAAKSTQLLADQLAKPSGKKAPKGKKKTG